MYEFIACPILISWSRPGVWISAFPLRKSKYKSSDFEMFFSQFLKHLPNSGEHLLHLKARLMISLTHLLIFFGYI